MTDVELIKSKVDIVSYISEIVPLKKAGRHFKANCPFHNEKSPSFIVSPERQTWHCFGACGTGGDVISFVQRWESIEFVEALKLLAARAGVTLSHQPAMSENVRQKERLYEVNHLAAEFYHYLLTKHKLGERAREYVSGRDINEKVVETFLLGYAPKSWDALSKYLHKKGYTFEEMETAGLVLKGQRGGYYDRFRGRLMFTLRDHRGNVVGFSGRVLPPASEKDLPAQAGAKYINTNETPVYIKGHMLYGMDITKESIKKEGYAVVVEGEFDMLASYQSGVPNIVAIKGTALTEEQLQLLGRYTQELRLALDSDFAGNEASRRGIEKAEAAGLTVRVVEVPEGKDPAECIAAGAHLWKQAVEKAVPVYDFLIASAIRRHDPSDVIGKKAIGELVIPFLARVKNPIVQSHYVRKLAGVLSISEESVQLSIRNAARGVRPEIAAPVPASRTAVSREEQQEIDLLALILQAPQPLHAWTIAKRIMTAGDCLQQPIGSILMVLETSGERHETFSVQDFVSGLPAEVIPTFDRAYLADVGVVIDDAQMYESVLLKTAREVKKTALRRMEEKIATQIKQQEGNESEIERLTKEFQEMRSQRLTIEKSGTHKVQ